jgi:Tol biopolymer transport system component
MVGLSGVSVAEVRGEAAMTDASDGDDQATTRPEGPISGTSGTAARPLNHSGLSVLFGIVGLIGMIAMLAGGASFWKPGSTVDLGPLLVVVSLVLLVVLVLVRAIREIWPFYSRPRETDPVEADPAPALFVSEPAGGNEPAPIVGWEPPTRPTTSSLDATTRMPATPPSKRASGVLGFGVALLVTLAFGPLLSQVVQTEAGLTMAILVLLLAGATIAVLASGNAAVVGAFVGGTIIAVLVLFEGPDPDLRDIYLALFLAVVAGPLAGAIVVSGVAAGRSARLRAIQWLTIGLSASLVAFGFVASSPLATAACEAGHAVSASNLAIVFTAMDDHNRPQVVGITADGNGRQELTNGPGVNTQPAWSPDGTRIAFATERELSPSVYVMASDGSCPRRVADGDNPTWSRDGRFIASRLGESDPQQIVITAVDGSTRQVLPPIEGAQFLSRAAWSPDGKSIAIGGDRGLALVDVASGSVKRWLTDGRVFGPAWSPDGKWITYHRYEEGAVGIYLVPADKGGRDVLYGSRFAYDAAWSPSGDRLVFADSPSGSDFYLASVATDGNDLRSLGMSTNSEDSSPSWRAVR